MRAGRLPDDHPLEQAAREKLRAKSPEAAAKAELEEQIPVAKPRPPVVASYQPPVVRRSGPPPKRRWG